MKQSILIFLILFLIIKCSDSGHETKAKDKESLVKQKITGEWKLIGTDDCLFKITKDTIMYFNEENSIYKYSLDDEDSLFIDFPYNDETSKIICNGDTLISINNLRTQIYVKCTD